LCTAWGECTPCSECHFDHDSITGSCKDAGCSCTKQKNCEGNSSPTPKPSSKPPAPTSPTPGNSGGFANCQFNIDAAPDLSTVHPLPSCLNQYGGLKKGKFTKYQNVFGVHMFAVAGVTDAKFLHACRVMAEFLDNDEDGSVDDSKVIGEMRKRNAAMAIWVNDCKNLPDSVMDHYTVQCLFASEIKPGTHGAGDATIEENLHLVTFAGYSRAYPTKFGETVNKPYSDIAKLMDIARGGHFTKVPNKYPQGAYYTYDDKTCDYKCQIAEFHYWALTSLLGGQTSRCKLIEVEWLPCTPAKMRQMAPELVTLMETMPIKILPNGKYTPGNAPSPTAPQPTPTPMGNSCSGLPKKQCQRRPDCRRVKKKCIPKEDSQTPSCNVTGKKLKQRRKKCNKKPGCAWVNNKCTVAI